MPRALNDFHREADTQHLLCWKAELAFLNHAQRSIMVPDGDFKQLSFGVGF